MSELARRVYFFLKQLADVIEALAVFKRQIG